MIANYHTHTPRCHHARGQESEYVLSAIDAGLQQLGFSDHTPYPFPEGYVSSFRMGTEELGGYCQTVLALKEQYANQIQIHLGVEAEYYPKYFPALLELLRDSPVQYMLLGQHFIGSEIGEHYCGIPTAEVSILQRYCDQCIDGMYTGLFSYLAHPDLLHFQGDRRVYQEQMRRICRVAKECGLPLEINFLGLREGRHYPNSLFWEVAGEENATVIFGTDAHWPEALKDPQSHQTALKMVETYGLTLVDTLTLRPIR